MSSPLRSVDSLTTNPPEKVASTLTPLGAAIVIWSVLGVMALFAQAILRLGPLALEPLVEGSLTVFQAGLYAFWVVFNAYAEGYRAFQRRFCPRVVERALVLSHNPKPLHVAFAPLFAMGLFHAKRRAKIISYALIVMILCFIVLLQHTPQPWRGIVDGGVVIALIWGELSMLYFLVRALGGTAPGVDPELPGSASL